MPRPVILAVDDDPQVLEAVRADLRRRYAVDHRILAEQDAITALATLDELLRRGQDVALLLVDQRMPGMSGNEFLVSARERFPAARRVLLTAYADTEVAIRAINDVGLDQYLLKPWDPPEQALYPVLDDLLGEWRATRPASEDGLRVLGTRWSATTHDVKEFLARNAVPYRFLDVERDTEEVQRLLDVLGEDDRALPVVVLPDGTALRQPSTRTVAERIGLSVQATAPFYDLAVVGAGPAGLAAALYGASEGLRTVVIERRATGGQAGQSSRIENYLGFPNGISGIDLARRATTQARRMGAEIVTTAELASLEVDGPVRRLHLSDGATVDARVVVLASGMTVRRLEAPGVEELTGRGVYYGATPDEAASYRGERVFVVGGANSAGQAAVMLSRYAKHVTLVVRGDSLEVGMSQYLVDQVAQVDAIEVRLATQVHEVNGDEHVERVVLADRHTGRFEEREGTGVFVFVGAMPHSTAVAGVVHRTDRGFVPTGLDLLREGPEATGWPLARGPLLYETSVPGVFAVGDVRDGAVRRVASAVGEGSICISLVRQYLESA